MSSGDAKGETEGESRHCSLTVVLSTVNQCIPALFSNTTMPVLLTLNTLWTMCLPFTCVGFKTPSSDFRPSTLCKLKQQRWISSAVVPQSESHGEGGQKGLFHHCSLIFNNIAPQQKQKKKTFQWLMERSDPVNRAKKNTCIISAFNTDLTWQTSNLSELLNLWKIYIQLRMGTVV